MWRRHRTHVAPARGEITNDRRSGTPDPSLLVGDLLFATRTQDGVVGLDCLLDQDESAAGVPVHCVWELPRDSGLAALQLGLVESWLDDGKQVRVALQVKATRSRLRLMCGDTTLVVDAREPAGSP